MIIFIPTFFLLATIAAILIAVRLRPDPRFYWMLSSVGAGLAWISNIFLRFRIPVAFSQSVWQINGIESIKIEWLLDGTAWSLSFAFLTFLLIFILVEVQNFLENQASKWVEILLVMTLVNLSAVSGNLLTLALFWISIDIFSAMQRLSASQKINSEHYLLIMLSKNIFSIFLLLWVLISQQNNLFTDQSETLNAILLLILGIRLGLILPDLKKYPRPSGFLNGENYSSFVSIFPAFVLFGRIEAISSLTAQIILWLAIITIFVIALKWNFSKQFEDAYPKYLMFSFGISFIFISQAYLAAALSMLILTLVLANLIPLLPHIVPYRPGILIVILWIFSALPYSPLTTASILYMQSPTMLVVSFTFMQFLMLSGWLSFNKKLKLSALQFEKWHRNIFALALLISFGVLIILSLDVLPISSSYNPVFSFWPFIAIIFAIAISYSSSVKARAYFSKLENILDGRISSDWGYSITSRISTLITNTLHLFSRLLEGNAGLLWAMLLIILMLSLVGQIGTSS